MEEEMALRDGVDFIFVPSVDVIMEKACLVCTPTTIYVVMDRKLVNMGFWREVLTESTTYRSVTFNDKTPRQIIAEVLSSPDATQESVQRFFGDLIERWDAVKTYQLDRAKVMKVSKGWWIFPGGIHIKFQGDRVYTLVTSAIPKPFGPLVHAFYADTVARINATP
jgi:hypothetical protein